MKKYRSTLILTIVLALFALFYFIGRSEYLFILDKPKAMNEGWVYDNKEILLPTDLNVPKGEDYSISIILNSDFHEPKYLLIRTSLQNITISLDGLVVYQKTYGESWDHPYASMWHLVLLPRHVDGQTLSLTFSSPYQVMSGQINEIFYGSEAMHYAYLLNQYGIRLLLNFFVFLVGLVLVISDGLFNKNQNRGYGYVGLFAVLLALWMFAESRMMQFFTGSQFLIGSLAYLVLPLFPIPLLIYLKNYVFKHYQKNLSALIYIFIAQFIFVVTLPLIGWLDFFQTVFFSQFWLVFAIVEVMILLIVEAKRYQNHEAIQFIKVFLILVIFGAFELVSFALGDFQSTSIFLSVGVAFLMVILSINYIRYIVQRMKLSHEKELYERLAYMDYVTQGQNRLAFERDLDEIFKDPSKREQLRLILFDLDGLKSINDSYGHVEGDKAIKKAFDIITEAFQDKGMCYRIGGDEFACLYQSLDESLYQQKKTFIDQQIQEYEDATPYHFGLSYGSASVNLPDMSAIDLIHQADQDMYEHKKKHKSSL